MKSLDTTQIDPSALKERASIGVNAYLEAMHADGRIAAQYYEDARRDVIANLTSWLDDPALDELSPHLKLGLAETIEQERWIDIVNAFVRRTQFGTGGIRALMAFDRESIIKLKEIGVDAPVIKGENTINNIVLMRAAHSIGRWLLQRDNDPSTPPAVVVGCDSRIQGAAFARAIAEVLLSQGLRVFLFDEPVPYPEVTFAIPFVGGDAGVFISASHNDYRYNGFKLSGPNGAQISITERDTIIERINETSFADLSPLALDALTDEARARLCFLGGEERKPDFEYFGAQLRPIHSEYVKQVQRFFMQQDLLTDGAAESLHIVYAAFNGAGRIRVPDILHRLGFSSVYPIASLFDLNGLFPAFKSDPGEEQQPDPGDPRAAEIALRELAKDEGRDGYIPWPEADILIGTDPDADRCGVVVKPSRALAELLPKHLESNPTPRYGPDHVLVPADDMWTLLLWYRLKMAGDRTDAERTFVALSHTTSDTIALLARKHRLGVLKTWVGFAWLSTAVRAAWAGEVPGGISEGRRDPKDEFCDLVYYDTTEMGPGRTINLAALEQSNGFSLLGGPAKDERSMGDGGHVLDKDGTLAALLVAEIAAYAKREGTDVLSLLARHVFADPDIGVFANYYEPDPLDGEYPGLEGDTKKRGILDRATALYETVRDGKEPVTFHGRTVTAVEVYGTGKYDAVNGPGFPDEGIRFYLGNSMEHLTVRPSGTTNSLRFHVQLHGGAIPDETEAWKTRLKLEASARQIVDEVRIALGAEREPGSSY